MQHVVSGIALIMSRRDSRLVALIAGALFIMLILLAKNGSAAFSALSFDALPLLKRLSLAGGTLFDVQNTFTRGALVLALGGALVGGINLSLAYTYIRLRGELITQSGLYSGMGLVLAFLGIGCAACGTALLSVLFSFFGASALLSLFPYQGLEIGFFGLLILSIATYVLAKKVNTPGVC